MSGSEECEVVIAGAGPTGLMVAAELALAGVEPVVVESRPGPEIDGSRGGGLHARTLEVLDQRGVADRFLAEGQIAQVTGFAGVTLDLSGVPTRHPYGLGLWQRHVQRILAEWVEELGVAVRYGESVEGFVQDEAGVAVALASGGRLRARYLVGCDGSRSTVRRSAGIRFAGTEATKSSLIAEVEMAEAPELGVRQDAGGAYGLGRVDYEIVDGEIVFSDSGPVRVTLNESEVGSRAEPSLEDLKQGLRAAYGTDFGAHSPSWISRFTDATRQADRYREGRVLLAGDAAHVHPPNGGQGLGTGVQDAVNLGWKLAAQVKGYAPPGLLETYHAERHPVGAAAIRTALAHVALGRTDDATSALRDTVAGMLADEDSRRRLGARMAGLDVRYALGEGHPLLGRRMPDLDITVDGRATRVFELLHDARPVLLDLGGLGVDLGGPAGRVRRVEAEYAGAWDLPVSGPVDPPAAVLIRPDGHVAWVGDGDDDGMAAALARWVGAPA